MNLPSVWMGDRPCGNRAIDVQVSVDDVGAFIDASRAAMAATSSGCPSGLLAVSASICASRVPALAPTGVRIAAG